MLRERRAFSTSGTAAYLEGEGLKVEQDGAVRDMRAGLRAGVDFVAISFVRSATDVQMVRERDGAARRPLR